MDEMPLTPGGKVDRKNLPDPRTAARAEARNLGPRDPVELRLKEIWEEAIGATVSIRDDFFLAGGHSLLAVRLVSRINSAFGTSHAVSWAFLNRTIEEQARSLRRDGRSAGFRPLVTFNGKGDRTPVFFVHPGQAGAEAYSALASLLGDDLPFHAVESRNLFDLERPMLDTVEGLAESYLEAILPVCGRGPCILGGWSFGGTVAFEIARRMLEQCIKVEELVMIDATRYDEKERQLMGELARAGEAEALLHRERLCRDLPETYRDRLALVMRLELEAMAAYQGGEYSGLAVLLKPIEEQPAAPVEGAAASLVNELTTRLAPKADNGWSAAIADLEVLRVPGDHLTMMEGRGLKETARILSGLRPDKQGQ
jgi:thioesterase domain-containing protein